MSELAAERPITPRVDESAADLGALKDSVSRGEI